MGRDLRLLLLATLGLAGPALAGDLRVLTADLPLDADFCLPAIPPPVSGDAGTKARWTLLDGTLDPKGAALDALHDDRLPGHEDDPASNCFFAAGSGGGAIVVDLGEPVALARIQSFSWHAGGRAPQVYRVFGATGTEEGFASDAAVTADPAKHGWTFLAAIDTHSGFRHEGGQHAAVVLPAAEGGVIGPFRHLLFLIDPSHRRDRFGHTFFSEIDLVAASAPPPAPAPAAETEPLVIEARSADRSLRIVADATTAPDLADWTRNQLLPLVSEWYPKIVALLPGEGFVPHDTVVLEFRDDLKPGVPAAATGHRIRLSAPWFRQQLETEAPGCVVHELVHVVQQYDRARTRNPLAAPVPGWITEGIADHVRWFRFEPDSRGAAIDPARAAQVTHADSYRVSANFLDWVLRRHGAGHLAKLNDAARSGQYRESLWQEWTGSDLATLGKAWKDGVARGGGEI